MMLIVVPPKRIDLPLRIVDRREPMHVQTLLAKPPVERFDRGIVGRHVVLTVNSSEPLERHEAKVLLSPINSGNTIYRPVRRGLDTFQTLDEYPYEERRK